LKRILFVCTGNTCRSPMAEALFRNIAAEAGLELEIRSAGVAAIPGGAMSDYAQQVLADRGVATDEFRSSAVTAETVDWADLILTMTVSHKQTLVHLFPKAADKAFTLKEFAAEPSESGVADRDVADPFGGTLDDYRACADELEGLLRKLADRLRREVR